MQLLILLGGVILYHATHIYIILNTVGFSAIDIIFSDTTPTP